MTLVVDVQELTRKTKCDMFLEITHDSLGRGNTSNARWDPFLDSAVALRVDGCSQQGVVSPEPTVSGMHCRLHVACIGDQTTVKASPGYKTRLWHNEDERKLQPVAPMGLVSCGAFWHKRASLTSACCACWEN